MSRRLARDISNLAEFADEKDHSAYSSHFYLSDFETMKRSHPAIGIDLGTTNSAVAFVDSTGRPETIRNSEGGLSTPSVIFFDRGNPVIGAEAVEAGDDGTDWSAAASVDDGERLSERISGAVVGEG